MNKITEIALDWLHIGIAPIPCYFMSKHPSIAWKRFQTVLPTEQQVMTWFASEHTNLAIITGWQGLTVIDFDSFDAYELWLDWYVTTMTHTEQPIFDRTLRVITGRGVHLYLMVDESVETAHVPSVVDIKATGYVVTAPSIHPNGRRYSSNDLPVARVKSLSGTVPDEWLLSMGEQRQWPAPPILSNTPLDRADQCQASLVATLRSRFLIQDFLLTDLMPTRDGWLITRCPFHEDHEPSFWVDTHRQLCGCYAGCNSKPMDVINLFGRLHGLSNGDAIAELARRM